MRKTMSVIVMLLVIVATPCLGEIGTNSRDSIENTLWARWPPKGHYLCFADGIVYSCDFSKPGEEYCEGLFAATYEDSPTVSTFYIDNAMGYLTGKLITSWGVGFEYFTTIPSFQEDFEGFYFKYNDSCTPPGIK